MAAFTVTSGKKSTKSKLDDCEIQKLNSLRGALLQMCGRVENCAGVKKEAKYDVFRSKKFLYMTVAKHTKEIISPKHVHKNICILSSLLEKCLDICFIFTDQPKHENH